MEDFEQIINVVRIILQNEEGRILFLKRQHTTYGEGKWTLPGGKIEEEETPDESCEKEVKEETNLDISNLKFLFKEEEISDKDGIKTKWIIFYYKSDFSGEIKINEESSEYKWMSQEELENEEIAFNQKEVLKKLI